MADRYHKSESGENNESLAFKYPQIALEWDYARNNGLSPQDFRFTSSYNAFWKCLKSGHSWQTKINHRTRSGSNCPKCWGRTASNENNFKAKYPELAETWHPSKNGELRPDMFTANSGKMMWWVCPKCKNDLHQTFNQRKRAKCGYCSGRFATEGNSLRAKFPQIAMQWDSIKNGESTPDNTPFSSGKTFWWKCSKSHEWKESPSNRIKGTECPYCVRKRASKEYNLKTEFPNIAEEWDNVKNYPLTSEDVLPKSSTKSYWWKCPCCQHSWQSKIIYRTANDGDGSTCPQCTKRYQSSKIEQRVFFELSAIFKDCENRKKINGIEVDIFINGINVAIEIDGYRWHKDKIERDLFKYQSLNDVGIKLFRFRERGLTQLKPEHEVVFSNNKITKESIDNFLRLLIAFLGEHHELISDINSYLLHDDFIAIDAYNRFANYAGMHLREKSLFVLRHDLIDEWDFTKNQLSPLSLTVGSGEVIWWKCRKCSHSWKTTVSHRTGAKPTGCPRCSAKHKHPHV